MFNISICDNDIKALNRIEELVEKFLKGAKLKIEIIPYSSSAEFCKRANLDQIDLLFLEINMVTSSDSNVVVELRKVNEYAKIIFISDSCVCTPDLFNCNPAGYIGKPIREEKFNQVFRQIIKKILERGPKFHYNADKKQNSIEKSKIIYLESKEHQIRIHKENKGEERFRGKLKEVGEQLLKSEFLQVGKSYIVNLNKIKSMGAREILMDDESKISISRSYKKAVLLAYAAFIEKKKCGY